MAIRTTGHINRLYPDGGGCYVRLSNADAVPKDGLFQLDLKHPNYNAIYSLLLLAATNGYPVSIRTSGEITPATVAVISYITVDW